MEIAISFDPRSYDRVRETIQKRAPEALKQSAVGARLRALREAHNLKPSEISDALGIERTYWTRWEKGVRPIPNDVAHQLTQMFEVDLDYILAGDTRAVPVALQTRLSRAEAS